MKHLHIYLTLLSFLSVSAWSYGEHLEANSVPVTDVPTHYTCEHDVIFNQYICYGEQR